MIIHYISFLNVKNKYWKYFILPSICLVCKQPEWQLCLNVQIMCGVKLNLKKYYLHDKLPMSQ